MRHSINNIDFILTHPLWKRNGFYSPVLYCLRPLKMFKKGITNFVQIYIKGIRRRGKLLKVHAILLGITSRVDSVISIW